MELEWRRHMYDLDLICGPGSQLPGQESHSVVSGSKSVSGHPIILLESESSQMTNQKNKGPGRMVKNEQATSSCIKQEETVNPTYRPLHCIADPSLRIDDPRISSKFLDGTAKEGLDQRCSADEIEHKKRQALMRSQAKELAVKKAAGVLQLKQYGVLVSDEIDKTGHSKYIKGLPAREFMPDPLVSSEQSKVLQAVRAGRNVFFTGSAGVGKSFLLKEICRYLQCVRKAFHVTAPTGIAAINVNGTTLHSFAKVGLGTEGWLAYSKRAAGPKQFQLWGETDVLIIDEISMVAPSLFEKIDQIARCARRVNRPLELPPVPQKEDCRKCGHTILVPCGAPSRELASPIFSNPPDWQRCTRKDCEFIVNADARYVFETKTWAELNFASVGLSQVFRQTDKLFVECLNRIRVGKPLAADLELLISCSVRSNEESATQIRPTRLYPQRAEVDTLNQAEFEKLEAPDHHIVNAYDSAHGPRTYASDYKRLSQLQAKQTLKLKIGSQVMLLCNLSFARRLVNGSRGVIVDFVSNTSAIADAEATIKTADGDKSLELKLLRDFSALNVDAKLPCVLFANGQTSVIIPHTWHVAIDANNSVSRTQIPLCLAWAMTIHKCQGLTLDRVELHLDRTFEDGQAYVALSRCRSLEGLYLASLDPSKIRADPRCIKFYASLEGGSTAPAPDGDAHLSPTRAYEAKLDEAIDLYLDNAEQIPGQEERELQIFLETCAEQFENGRRRHNLARHYSNPIAQPLFLPDHGLSSPETSIPTCSASSLGRSYSIPLDVARESRDTDQHRPKKRKQHDTRGHERRNQACSHTPGSFKNAEGQTVWIL